MLTPSPLVGLAIGDALGMPFGATVEGVTSWDGSYQASARHGLGPGQWTDDTVMARLLAESLVFCGGYFPRDAADRYLHWYQQGPAFARGMGRSTRAALENLAQGVPWAESGVISTGTGAAMRAAPLGFFYQEDPNTARAFASLDAKITHRSVEAEQGAIAIAVGVALLASGRATPETVVGKVMPYLASGKVRNGLGELSLSGNLRGASGCVRAAFYAFCSATSFREAVTTAVRAGGDAIASMTGALAGAYYGESAIPSALVDPLEDVKHLRRLDQTIRSGPRTQTILWKR